MVEQQDNIYEVEEFLEKQNILTNKVSAKIDIVFSSFILL